MGDSQPRKLEEHIFHEFLLIVGLASLALVQTTLVPAPFGFSPALLVIFVVCRILVGMGESSSPESDMHAALRWAFYGGIALDICAATPLGSHALALLLSGILVITFAGRLWVSGPLLPLLAVLLGTGVYELTLAVIYHYTVAFLDWGRYTLVILIPTILLTLIPTLPIFHLLRWRYTP